MAKGQASKEKIFAKLLEVFPGSFMQDDKICRLPFEENGEIVEIKVTLTAAKDVIGAGASSNRTPGPTATEEFDWSENSASTPQAAAANSLNETEKENIRKMMEALGL